MKRPLLLALILLLALGLVAFGYFFRSKPGTTPSDTTTGNLPSGSAGGSGRTPTPPSGPGLPSGKTQLVIDAPIISYHIDRDGGVIALKQNGTIVRMFASKQTLLSDSELVNIASAGVSPDATRVFVILQGATSKSLSVFDIATKTWKALSLPATISHAFWSPTDSRLAYTTEDQGITTVFTIDIKAKTITPKKLFALHGDDFVFSWESPSRIFITTPPSAFAAQPIYYFDVPTQKISLFSEGKLGAEVLWGASSSSGLLFSSATSQRGGVLSLISPSGGAIESFSFITLPHKCAFASHSSGSSTNDTLFCAVPRDIPTINRSVLPDDYLKKAILTSDAFLSINLENGVITNLYNGDSNFDAIALQPFGSSLYFVNRYDNKLYVVTK